MDIKLKKSKKTIIRVIAFFAGISLLVYGLTGMALTITGNGNHSINPVQELFERDYQNTQEFRKHISYRLENFIAMATGSYMDNYYGTYDYYYNENEAAASGTAVVIEEKNWEGYDNGSWYGKYYSPEENKQSADRLHQYLEKDKNMLYQITYDGELLYSNTGDLSLDGESGLLPDGYNFLLYFNGSTVTCIKDGKELDIYGDGYYREDSDWYVPGYKNFITEGDMKKATVCIAAAKETAKYSYSNYRLADNSLYWIEYHMAEARKDFFRQMVCILAGALLCVVYLTLGRKKGEAGEALAAVTGRIWLELKIILIITAIALGLTWNGSLFYSSFENLIENISIMSQEITYSGNYSSQSWFLREFLLGILYNPFMLVILFWCIYLSVNDIRKNKKVWKHSLIYKVICPFKDREMQLKLSNRLAYRCIFLFLFSTGFCLSVLLLALYAANRRIQNPVMVLLLYLAGFILFIGLQYYFLARMKTLAKDMDLLAQRASAIRNGEYVGRGELPEESDLAAMAADLEEIREGMSNAIEEQIKSQRMKVELVANVSHDIKTPLTSIISYVQFLKQEEGLPAHVADYIHILDEKSQRLKNMVQDVFSVSKAASGQLPVNIEELDFGKLLLQTLADMDEQIQNNGLAIKTEIPEEPVLIDADGQRMYRVFQNLIQNALKYSLEGSRIYITLKNDGTMAAASVKNTSKYEINPDKDFTERFVRGDESRTDGGSGLGLSIARSFTEACHGSFQIETIADLFVVTISFPRK